ncbi:MAG: hypothetical protein IAE91_09800 [Ignavibacteriaceae bacterium]|nr:hypothetical protein [Ignavibacteriaceae bacterium]
MEPHEHKSNQTIHFLTKSESFKNGIILSKRQRKSKIFDNIFTKIKNFFPEILKPERDSDIHSNPVFNFINSGMLIWLTDQKGNCIAYSEKLLSYFESPELMLNTQNIINYLNKEGRIHFENLFSGTNCNNVIIFEFYISGLGKINMELNKLPFYEKKELYYLWEAKDITDLELNKIAMREYENALDSIVQSCTNIKLIIDTTNFVIYKSNKLAQNFYGCSELQLNKLEIGDILPFNIKEIKNKFLDRENPEITNEFHFLVNKDGNHVRVRTDFSFFRLNMIDYLVCDIVEIPDSKAGNTLESQNTKRKLNCL